MTTIGLTAPEWRILRQLAAAPKTGSSRQPSGPGRLPVSQLGDPNGLARLRRMNLVQRFRDPQGGEDQYLLTHLGERTVQPAERLRNP